MGGCYFQKFMVVMEAEKNMRNPMSAIINAYDIVTRANNDKFHSASNSQRFNYLTLNVQLTCTQQVDSRTQAAT